MTLVRVPYGNGLPEFDIFIVAPEHLNARSAAACVAGHLLQLKAVNGTDFVFDDLMRLLKPKGFTLPSIVMCSESLV